MVRRASDWTKTLRTRDLGNLDLLNHDTEQYFLKIGEKLAGSSTP